MIKGIAHTCFNTANLAAIIEFYNAIGLPVAFEFRRDDGSLFGVYFRVGNRTFIEFFTHIARPADAANYRHICFEVDDINATVADIRAKGIKISDPKLGSDNSWQAWLADPDGNPIELHSYTPTSWQAPHL